jgi:hypothetical protein
MKRLGGWFGVAVFVLGVTGCDSGGPSTPAGPAQPTADNRPAGFEDMMKGMNDKMTKKAGSAPKVAPSTAPR